MSATRSLTKNKQLLSSDVPPRTHSLYDLETDRVLKLNQTKASCEESVCPSWTDQKYKICGSFKNLLKANDNNSANTDTGSAETNKAQDSNSVPTTASNDNPTDIDNIDSNSLEEAEQETYPGSTPRLGSVGSRLKLETNLEKKDSFFDDPLLDAVNFDEMLQINDNTNNSNAVNAAQKKPRQQFQNPDNQGGNMSAREPEGLSQTNVEYGHGPSDTGSHFPYQFHDIGLDKKASMQSLLLHKTLNDSMNMFKRQSFVDFEKTLKFFSPSRLPSFRDLKDHNLNFSKIFGSFLSRKGSNSNLNNVTNFDDLLLMDNVTNVNVSNQMNSYQHHFENPVNMYNNYGYMGSSNINPHFHNPNISNISPQNMQSFDSDMSENLKRKLSNGKLLRNNGRSKKRGKWSEMEDSMLQQLANEFVQRNEKINFKKISEKLPGRTAKQCREHWLSTLNPELKKGRWTRAEEEKLIDLMIEHGKAWSVIAKAIPGRAEHSVKAKGRLMLGERLKSIPTNARDYGATKEEKQRLLILHQQLGSDFDEISKQSGFVISPAKVERTMLALCHCTYCKTLQDTINACDSPNMHHGWTKIKAAKLKTQFKFKASKYQKPELYGSPADIPGGIEEKESSPGSEFSPKFSSFSKFSKFAGANGQASNTQPLRNSIISNSSEFEDAEADFEDDDDDENENDFNEVVPVIY